MKTLAQTAKIPTALAQVQEGFQHIIGSSKMITSLLQTIEEASTSLRRGAHVTIQHIQKMIEKYLGIADYELIATEAAVTADELLLYAEQTTQEASHVTQVFTETESRGTEIFKFTTRTAQRMEQPGRMIPLYILQDIINDPLYVLPDPQGTSAMMYYTHLWKNKKLYNVEVLYHKQNNLIMRFVYTKEPLGPLQKISSSCLQ